MYQLFHPGVELVEVTLLLKADLVHSGSMALTLSCVFSIVQGASDWFGNTNRHQCLRYLKNNGSGKPRSHFKKS